MDSRQKTFGRIATSSLSALYVTVIGIVMAAVRAETAAEFWFFLVLILVLAVMVGGAWYLTADFREEARRRWRETQPSIAERREQVPAPRPDEEPKMRVPLYRRLRWLALEVLLFEGIALTLIGAQKGQVVLFAALGFGLGLLVAAVLYVTWLLYSDYIRKLNFEW